MPTYVEPILSGPSKLKHVPFQKTLDKAVKTYQRKTLQLICLEYRAVDEKSVVSLKPEVRVINLNTAVIIALA